VAGRLAKYIDGFADKTSTLAKDEMKELIISAKKDESEFVRLQAENVERWTEMRAAGELTPAGFKKQMSKLDVPKNWRLSSWKSRLKRVLVICHP